MFLFQPQKPNAFVIALAVSTAGRDSLLSAQRESMSWQVVKRGYPLTALRRFDQILGPV